jgi:hypothetical protein
MAARASSTCPCNFNEAVTFRLSGSRRASCSERLEEGSNPHSDELTCVCVRPTAESACVRVFDRSREGDRDDDVDCLLAAEAEEVVRSRSGDGDCDISLRIREGLRRLRGLADLEACRLSPPLPSLAVPSRERRSRKSGSKLSWYLVNVLLALVDPAAMSAAEAAESVLESVLVLVLV